MWWTKLAILYPSVVHVAVTLIAVKNYLVIFVCSVIMSQAECMVDVFVNVSDQRGVVLQDIYNKDGNDQYRFYYHDPHDSALRWLHYLLLLFWHAPLGVRSTIHRHQPPQRTVLGQVNCFVQCEVIGSQTDMRTPWWSLPVIWWGAARIMWHVHHLVSSADV